MNEKFYYNVIGYDRNGDPMYESNDIYDIKEARALKKQIVSERIPTAKIFKNMFSKEVR